MRKSTDLFESGRYVVYETVRVRGAVRSATGELLFVGNEEDCLRYLRDTGSAIAATELRRRAEEAEEAESP